MTTDERPSAPTLIGTSRFERYLVLITAAFGVLFACQDAASFAVHLTTVPGPLGAVSTVLAVASVVVGLVPCVAPRRASCFFRAAVVLFLIALLIWPFAIRSAVPASPMPWFVAMWPCEAAYLVVVKARALVPVVVSLAAVLFTGAVLLLVGHLDLGDVFSNAFFMTAASGVLLLMVHSVRQGVARADAAQDLALGDYGRTRFDDAAEAERIRTDALVHDSVITTFLAAADARTPESEDLTRRMAANALRVLAHVNRSAEMGPALPFRTALSDASDELALLLPHFEVRSGAIEDVVLPTAVNDALVGAMAQAMTNSLQHAGPVTRRTVEITELGTDGIRIVIADDGDGFHLPAAVATRLGIRVSIIDRLRRVDGRADVTSEPGRGTTVVLSWGSVVISGTAPFAHEERGTVPA